MELEGGHRNSVIKRRNPIEFGLVEVILLVHLDESEFVSCAHKRHDEAVQENMLAEMLRAKAASAMENCALPKPLSAHPDIRHPLLRGFGFVDSNGSPLSMLCSKLLPNRSMALAKFRRDLETVHPESKDKNKEFFVRKKEQLLESQKNMMHVTQTINEKATEASYLVSYRIAQAGTVPRSEIRAGLLNPNLLSPRPGSELKARLRSKSKVRQIGIEIRIGVEIINGRYIRCTDNSLVLRTVIPSIESVFMSRDATVSDFSSSSIETVVIMNKISNLLDEKINKSFSIFIENFRNLIRDDIKSMVCSEVNQLLQTLKDEFTVTIDFICAEQSRTKKTYGTVERVDFIDFIKWQCEGFSILWRAVLATNVRRSCAVPFGGRRRPRRQLGARSPAPAAHLAAGGQRYCRLNLPACDVSAEHRRDRRAAGAVRVRHAHFRSRPVEPKHYNLHSVWINEHDRRWRWRGKYAIGDRDSDEVKGNSESHSVMEAIANIKLKLSITTRVPARNITISASAAKSFHFSYAAVAKPLYQLITITNCSRTYIQRALAEGGLVRHEPASSLRRAWVLILFMVAEVDLG
ncbi:Zinc finger BED domain-containing protein 5 [Eumeta japonica]|uniref:Zinc finger BED domain-containing protein 5 n=1 Tax=Eumeta variegata TaxID=151549 RepID=A0A4C1XNK1_EUMVA|nr:Zinc finger BED domain-containing protein 5 [Eumeta japonica]